MGLKLNNGIPSTSANENEWWSPKDKSNIAIAHDMSFKLSDTKDKKKKREIND